jgi:inhibitor of the pro-sigma K processing machinery
MPDLNVILAVIFGLIVLYLVARMMVVPARLLLRLVACVLVGTGSLFLFNLAGGFFGVHLGINPVTSLLVGYMGLPGLVMLLLLRQMLG